jgi:hypothetical protein
MRVRIIAKGGYFNPRRGIEAQTGSVIDVSDDLAVKMLAGQIAVPAPAPVKTAAVAPPENAAQRVGKPKSKASKSSPPAKEEAE